MFMGWTKEDGEDLVRGLRFLLGVPVMAVLILLSLETLMNGKYNIPWNPVTFLAGCGLALALKLIEVTIYKITGGQK